MKKYSITKEMIDRIKLACLDKTVKNQEEAFKKHIPELPISKIERLMKEHGIKVPKEVISSRRSGENNPFYGKQHSEETKKILKSNGEARIGWTHSEETKDKIRKANIGKIVSDETKKKISDQKKGIPLKPEHIQKIKDWVNSHPHPNKGRKLTQEEKDNISKKKKGKKHDEAFREKCRQRMKGFKHSDEAKMKIAYSNSVRTISDSFREKASSNTKRLWREGVFKKRTIEYVSKRFGRFLLKSSYELKFLMDLEADTSIETIEYEILECEYVDEKGIKRITSGDFLINKTTLKEIKTDTLWQNKERSLLKINAMREHCKKLNIKYELVTERELGLLDSAGNFKKKEYDELNALAKSLLLINKDKINE